MRKLIFALILAFGLIVSTVPASAHFLWIEPIGQQDTINPGDTVSVNVYLHAEEDDVMHGWSVSMGFDDTAVDGGELTWDSIVFGPSNLVHEPMPYAYEVGNSMKHPGESWINNIARWDVLGLVPPPEDLTAEQDFLLFTGHFTFNSGIWDGLEDVWVEDDGPIDGWDFDSMFDEAAAGSTFRFELVRNGRRIVVEETFLAGRDGYEAFRRCLKTPRRWIGVYLIQTLNLEWNITRKLRDQGMFNYSSLCYVLEVYPGSPADRAGLKQEDFILDYGVPDDNGEIMPYDVVDHLYELKPGESLDLTVLRDKKDVIKIKIMPEETLHKGYF